MECPKDLILRELENEDKIVLLSIKPEYSKLIFHGEKTVELRKTFPTRYRKYAFVYESHPVKKIAGILKIREIRIKDVKELMRLTGKAKVTNTFIREYFSNRRAGIAIEIGERFEFEKKIPLRNLREEMNFVPPQNFRYLKKDEIFLLLRGEYGSRRTYRRGIFSKERILNFFKHKIRRQ